MRYKLQMMDTDFGVGMFAAMPEPNLSFNEMADHLRKYPLDDYMHEFVLQGFKDFRTRKLEKLIKGVMKDNGASDPVLTAVMYEACLCHERQRKLLPLFDGLDPASLLDHTPAIHIRSHLQADQPDHTRWIRIFGDNLFELAPLPHPDETGLPPLFSEEDLQFPDPVPASKIRHSLEGKLPPAKERKPLEETLEYAFRVLDKADAFLGPVMAHKASLSPIASLRHWMVKVRCANGRMSNALQGIQTSYGRGLSRAQADASCSMEMAERFSSYASFGNKGVLGYERDYPLTYAAYDDLEEDAVNLREVRLEVPYAGQKIHWFEGHAPDGKGGTVPVLVPAQFVFLFCNLDEQSLFSALGSTGLASGNTLDEAKVSALTEVIERDSDATMPFDPSRCFRVESDDPELSTLLDNYAADGIHVWFQDVTTELGVPCYKSVVLGKHGDVNKGGGCSLCGKSALISAMTETAYPHPGPPSSPPPRDCRYARLRTCPTTPPGARRET